MTSVRSNNELGVMTSAWNVRTDDRNVSVCVAEINILQRCGGGAPITGPRLESGA